jgi:hypothetical protein
MRVGLMAVARASGAATEARAGKRGDWPFPASAKAGGREESRDQQVGRRCWFNRCLAQRRYSTTRHRCRSYTIVWFGGCTNAPPTWVSV